MTDLRLRGDCVEVAFDAPVDGPVSIAWVTVAPSDAHDTGGQHSLISPHPMVVLFTAVERQSGRMTHSYADSAIGRRLRYASHRAWSDTVGSHLELLQRDEITGLAVLTTVTAASEAAALRFAHEVRNEGAGEARVVALASASLGFRAAGRLADLVLTSGESGWTTEGRWRDRTWGELLPQIDLTRYGQDAAARFARTSHGTWSTGEFHPLGVLSEPSTGLGLAWEIESSGPWHWEIGATPQGGYVSILGPADAEHHFAVGLAPGARLAAPPVTVAFSHRGRDGVIAALTDGRRSARRLRPADAALPVVYNDFLDTLVGDPSTERLEPLIRAAAAIGGDVFCIDAGWFAERGRSDWWSRVGAWREGDDRFTGGLQALLRLIRSYGMVPGMWLEPEVVGVASEVADSLPDDAFLRRNGERVVVHDRYHLDFSHAAARKHADAAVDRLVDDLGAGYVKLDYNVDPAGADAIDLLRHVRAHRAWLEEVQMRHPRVLFENCAAGGMRADAGILALAHLQSTSDQPDPLAYAVIAATAPLGILPEQCGNWARPDKSMTLGEIAFSLVTGLAGRLYLSGFLDELDDAQSDLVREAVAVAKGWRGRVAHSHPLWPLGVPSWDSPHVALGLDCGDVYLVALWSRGEPAQVTLEFPVALADCRQVFPSAEPAWRSTIEHTALVVDFPASPAARLLAVAKLPEED